jgi:hypothetical protein
MRHGVQLQPVPQRELVSENSDPYLATLITWLHFQHSVFAEGFAAHLQKLPS